MKKNLGKVDRVARIFIGLVILIVSVTFQSWWALLGLGFLLTAATGYCFPYQILGISTLESNSLAKQK